MLPMICCIIWFDIFNVIYAAVVFENKGLDKCDLAYDDADFDLYRQHNRFIFVFIIYQSFNVILFVFTLLYANKQQIP